MLFMYWCNNFGYAIKKINRFISPRSPIKDIYNESYFRSECKNYMFFFTFKSKCKQIICILNVFFFTHIQNCSCKTWLNGHSLSAYYHKHRWHDCLRMLLIKSYYQRVYSPIWLITITRVEVQSLEVHLISL